MGTRLCFCGEGEPPDFMLTSPTHGYICVYQQGLILYTYMYIQHYNKTHHCKTCTDLGNAKTTYI